MLSERTVESHVRTILAKLGYSTRTEIATWSLRRWPGAGSFDQYHWPRFGHGEVAPEYEGALGGSYATDGALV